jgi:hypothetical protein
MDHASRAADRRIIDLDLPATEDPETWLSGIERLAAAGPLIVDGRIVSLSFRNPNARLQRGRYANRRAL